VGVGSGNLGGHDLSIIPRMFGSGTASHPYDCGVGPIVAKSHCLHPDAEQGSAPAYRSARDQQW
jgi:hypothetical protein